MSALVPNVCFEVAMVVFFDPSREKRSMKQRMTSAALTVDHVQVS
jgi:hypothetical protein